MSDNRRSFEVPMLSPEYFENRRNFPPEELLQYAGLYIAWSLDGLRILAAGKTEEEMEAKLIEAGIKPSHVVGAYIPPLGESLYY
jgi:hypothetical protein